ncbi:HD domain-containing phosphohydrolase [Natronospora cellulosivora (SeqCode)]
MKEISMFKIIKSLSDILDLLSKSVVSHHKKVAYIAYNIAKEMNLNTEDKRNLLTASLIHDIGVFYLDIDLNDLSFDDKSNLHASVGYFLIRDNDILKEVASIIRYHHLNWEQFDNTVPLTANIVYLADRIAVLSEKLDIYNERDKINQIISENIGINYCPKAVLAFKELLKKESFCLDIRSQRSIEQELDKFMFDLNKNINIDSLKDISKLISYIIDFRSPYTATHSVGIAAVSKELFKFMGYSVEKQLIMETAAYLHDIGKLVVPLKVLNKPGKLNANEWRLMRSHTYYTYQVLQVLDEIPFLKEWAAYHHEKLDGQGYPFHLHANSLSMGARVMAVADIFTAITEDRPYRKGMKKEQVIKIFKDLINKGKIDKNVVSVLFDNFEELNNIRENNQLKAGRNYQEFERNVNAKINSTRSNSDDFAI